MSEQRHTILGGKVQIYRRTDTGPWQCSASFDGIRRRASTGLDSLRLAQDFAEDWYLTFKGKRLAGELTGEKTFREAAALYEAQIDVLTGGTRSRVYLDGAFGKLRVHLVPFFGDLPLSKVTSAKINEYRVKRQTPVGGRTIARNTLHQEIVALRQVLKAALREGWLDHLPDMSAPYKSGTKISHRAWFSRTEYKALVDETRRQAKEAEGGRWEHEAAQMLDYILIMANTGLRPDEVKKLQYRDVAIDEDAESGETILVIEVRGKRGVGYCKSTASAVFPFERMVARNNPKPTDLLFPLQILDRFNRILDKLNLKVDREGQPRTPYSLRHTYISFRLLEGADIYQVAKNCRTSVEMIEKFYASHIQSSISASALNVRRKPLSDAKEKELERRNTHRILAEN